MKTLNMQEMKDLLVGTEILGCGGGGSIQRGRNMIEEAYSEGLKFTMVDPKEIRDDDLVIIVGRVGGGVPKEILERIRRFPKITRRPGLVAVKELAQYIQREPTAFLASEIGPSNTVLPMYIAAVMGKPVIDADACGRAKPELSISTTHLKGVASTPLVMVSQFGDIAILKKAVDDYRAEDICRYVALISGGVCGVARCPTKGELIREAIVPNSITRCIKLGEAVRKASETGINSANEAIRSTGGLKIFEGEVRTWRREEKEAFMWGTIIINGTGDHAGHKLKVWFKNEFLISWRNEQPYVTCPDTICIVDAETGRGMSNWIDDLRIYVRKKVVVFGLKAPEIWRTERGVQIFGPKHFGYPIKYVPIEKVMKSESYGKDSDSGS